MAEQEPHHDINELAAKYRDGTATLEEKAAYERWWRSFDDAQALSSTDNAAELEARMYAGIDARINPEAPKMRD